MSESDDGPGRREVAYRLFATEYDDADFQFSESDEERAPNYVITPTGGRVNRLFVVGVLTEVESVSDDVLRGRVVDPTGGFVLYAGQYQPDERAVLDRMEPPEFVAVTGKARTFQPDDSDRVFTSVRPESISAVDADTRDRWTVDAAEQTLHRVEAMARAIALGSSGDTLRNALVDLGYDEGLAAGVSLALDHYGTTPTYLAAVRDLALDAARHVAGDLDEIPELTVDPDTPGEITASDLLEEPVEALAREADQAPENEPAPAEAAETEPVTDESPVGPDAAEADGPTTRPDPESEAGGVDGGTGDGPGDFDPDEYDLDEEAREEVEAEYGTEFQTAADVDDPGEADIETPDPEVDTDAEAASEPPDEPTPESTESEDGEDLVDAVVTAMGNLDDGDGAARSAVVDAVVDRTGADADAVEDAIQEALMDGRCYEPDDATLMPI